LPRSLLNHDRKGVLSDASIAVGLFIGSLLLLGPWLTTDLSDQPWNNGHIYIGIARLFRDRSSLWNPLQYGGSRFHYLYPPMLPTLAALLRFLSIGRAFHLVSGIGYALAPVCLYILGRQLFRSRLPAIFAALAYAVFPSLLYLLPQVRVLGHPYANAPWSYVALVAYDEAPHAFALPFLLLAVAAAWRNRWTLAALFAAAVFLTSWPGLIGLGFPLAGIAVARWRDFGAVRAATRVVGVAATAYGLAAFWMTPAYFVSSRIYNRVVFRHTMLTAPWNRTTWLILSAALLVLAFSFWPRVPSELALTAVWTALSSLVVLSYLIAGNYLLPLPHRYLLELSAGLALLLAALLSLAPPPSRTVAAAVLIAVGLALSFRFVTHSWKFEPKSEDPNTQAGYQAAMWLKGHAGRARVLASGELDSTLSLWTDVAQVGGPGQDPSNFLVFAAERQIAFGCDADSGRVAELWLRALNAPLLVVHGATSREYFHWYARPDRFAALPVAWDNGAGDRIYRLPNFDAHEAVVVDLGALATLPPITSTADDQFLSAYVQWAAGKRPVTVHWTSSGSATFDVNLSANEAVLLKVNNDPGWRAPGASIEADPIGFQLIRASPGQRHVTLRFGASWDAWLGRAITLATIILLLAGVQEIWIAAVVLIPAAAACAFLISTTPRAAQLAEDAFARLQPPLITTGGIVDNGTSQPPPFQRGQQISIYGSNFGPPGKARVLIGDHPVAPEFQSPNLIDLRWPADAPASAPVSVEVHGCIGNAFTVTTR
jgi:IPT/TIG domain